MGTYRVSRNIEASFIEYIETELSATGGWSGVTVTKTFADVDGISLPVICIRCGNTGHTKAQLGDESTVREANLLIDIFAENDGQRLDLKDWLIDKVKAGIPYTEFTINNGTVSNRTINGRIRVIDIDDVPIDFDVPKNELEPPDRYRHLLTLTVSLGKVEA